MKFVAVTTPGLKKDKEYEYHARALKEDALIKSADRSERTFEGRTMVDTAVWLDFLHNASLIWGIGLRNLHSMTECDGIWTSDAEINNYCNGEYTK